MDEPCAALNVRSHPDQALTSGQLGSGSEAGQPQVPRRVVERPRPTGARVGWSDWGELLDHGPIDWIVRHRHAAAEQQRERPDRT